VYRSIAESPSTEATEIRTGLSVMEPPASTKGRERSSIRIVELASTRLR
jgi:hypothetical protein